MAGAEAIPRHARLLQAIPTDWRLLRNPSENAPFQALSSSLRPTLRRAWREAISRDVRLLPSTPTDWLLRNDGGGFSPTVTDEIRDPTRNDGGGFSPTVTDEIRDPTRNDGWGFLLNVAAEGRRALAMTVGDGATR